MDWSLIKLGLLHQILCAERRENSEGCTRAQPHAPSDCNYTVMSECSKERKASVTDVLNEVPSDVVSKSRFSQTVSLVVQ